MFKQQNPNQILNIKYNFGQLFYNFYIPRHNTAALSWGSYQTFVAIERLVWTCVLWSTRLFEQKTRSKTWRLNLCNYIAVGFILIFIKFLIYSFNHHGQYQDLLSLHTLGLSCFGRSKRSRIYDNQNKQFHFPAYKVLIEDLSESQIHVQCHTLIL